MTDAAKCSTGSSARRCNSAATDMDAWRVQRCRRSCHTVSALGSGKLIAEQWVARAGRQIACQTRAPAAGRRGIHRGDPASLGEPPRSRPATVPSPPWRGAAAGRPVRCGGGTGKCQGASSESQQIGGWCGAGVNARRAATAYPCRFAAAACCHAVGVVVGATAGGPLEGWRWCRQELPCGAGMAVWRWDARVDARAQRGAG